MFSKHAHLWWWALAPPLSFGLAWVVVARTDEPVLWIMAGLAQLTLTTFSLRSLYLNRDRTPVEPAQGWSLADHSRYAFIDKDNNIIKLLSYNEAILDPVELQRQFEQFQDIVAQQGKMSLCVGNTHLVQLKDLGMSLHLVNLPDEGHTRKTFWQVKYDPVSK